MDQVRTAFVFILESSSKRNRTFRNIARVAKDVQLSISQPKEPKLECAINGHLWPSGHRDKIRQVGYP